MKKALAILLLLCLLLSSLPALAASSMSEKEKIAHLKEIVQSYLDSKSLPYSYDAEAETFDLRYTLDSTLGSCDVNLYLYDDMLSITAIPSLRVPDSNKDKTAIYLTLANDNIYYAQFRMNYENGRVSCRNAQVIEDVFPSESEVDLLLNMAVYTLDKYGDGLNKVAQLGYDPHAAFQETLQADASNSL